MEWRGLALRSFRYPPEHLGGSRLIIAHITSVTIVMVANRFEQAERAEADHVRGVLRLIERDPDVRLRGEIINFVGQCLFDYAAQAGGVAEVAIMKLES